MKVRMRILLLPLVAIALVVASFLYLFRTRVQDNPDLGLITYRWKWGAAREVLADTNRDGAADFRGRFRGWSATFYTHQQWAEAWESSQCDGRFDVHLIASSTGDLAVLEYDGDRDGRFETVLQGQALLSKITGLAAVEAHKQGR